MTTQLITRAPRAHPVYLVDPATETDIGVGGGQNGYTSRVSVTRPANTTPYTAGDVIGSAAAAIEMTSIGPAGGSILITGADLEIDVSAIPSGMTSFTVEVYNVTPPSALADNAAWDLPSGDRDAYLGFIELGVVADKGSTLYCQADQVNKQFKLASGSTSLFCYLKTIGGFTPAGNSEVYRLRMRSVGL